VPGTEDTRGTTVAIGLGSNVGDRLARIRFAAGELKALIEEPRLSSLYETEPLHITDQPDFLNACCTGRTALSPRALLQALQAIERAAGRVPGERYGPRSLDLDILLYGHEVIEERGLDVPHPRMPERAFVLVPLLELLPEWRHPTLGRSVSELAGAVSRAGVRPFDLDDDPAGVRR